MAAKKTKWAIWIVIALVVIGLAIYLIPKLSNSSIGSALKAVIQPGIRVG